MSPPSSPVRPVDLDDDHLSGAEAPSQAGSTGPGAFDADTLEFSGARRQANDAV